MRKIHCLNPISKLGTGLLTENYEMTDNLAEAEGILVRSAAMHDLELPKGLRAVARAGAGVNNIPLDKCAEAGIVVFNTPGANANGVKELVLAGMLLGARDVVGGIDWCKEQKDNENISKDMEKAKKKFAGHEIRGKKLGVIGLGAIGAEVANAAAALGMEVYGYDPFISVKAAWMLSRDVKHITSVDTIYQECDYITVHVPLLDSTRQMINKDSLGQMKDGVVILNFARDLLVNDDDMAEALASGRVKRYITDFPNAKVSVLSNSTFIDRPAVFDALNKIDNNILKLDTVNEEYIHLLDRPNGKYSVRKIIEKMKEFKGNCIIQTMFLKGSYLGKDMNNTSDEFVLPWLEAVKEIAPSQVMIYTIDRETPDHDLQKATHEELDRIVELIKRTGIPATASY